MCLKHISSKLFFSFFLANIELTGPPLSFISSANAEYIRMGDVIVDVPGGFTDPATALPVQIYLWADSPERAFAERTSAAIIVLLGFLFVMNIAAVVIRKKMERAA